jgi:hypothetical protein
MSNTPQSSNAQPLPLTTGSESNLHCHLATCCTDPIHSLLSAHPPSTYTRLHHIDVFLLTCCLHHRHSSTIPLDALCLPSGSQHHHTYGRYVRCFVLTSTIAKHMLALKNAIHHHSGLQDSLYDRICSEQSHFLIQHKQRSFTYNYLTTDIQTHAAVDVLPLSLPFILSSHYLFPSSISILVLLCLLIAPSLSSLLSLLTPSSFY